MFITINISTLIIFYLFTQRGAARQKLQQIEDLFEARYAAATAISAASATRSAVTSNSGSAGVSDGAGAGAENVSSSGGSSCSLSRIP